MARQYNYQQKPGESLDAYYHRIAKVADQRLLRLEALEKLEGYGNANQWAYKRAMSDIQTWSGDTAKRFHTKAPASTKQLQAKINDIQTFLGSDSSTKSGIDRIYKKRVKTINDNFDANFTVDEFKKLTDSSLWKRIEGSDYGGSDTVFEAIASIKKASDNDKDLFDKLKAQDEFDKTLPPFTGDRMVDNTIKEMLSDADTIEDMYQYFKMI